MHIRMVRHVNQIRGGVGRQGCDIPFQFPTDVKAAIHQRKQWNKSTDNVPTNHQKQYKEMVLHSKLTDLCLLVSLHFNAVEYVYGNSMKNNKHSLDLHGCLKYQKITTTKKNTKSSVSVVNATYRNQEIAKRKWKHQSENKETLRQLVWEWNTRQIFPTTCLHVFLQVIILIISMVQVHHFLI